MGIETFGVPLAYVIVASLCLWIAIGAKGWWWLKAVVIALSVFFGVALWLSLDSLQGWPVREEMPPRFEILWLLTEEPNKKTGAPGAVYVWAKDLDPEAARKVPFFLQLGRIGPGAEPRIFKLDYSRPLHEQAEEIQNTIRGGGRFFGTLKGGGLTERTGAAGPAGGGRGAGTEGALIGGADEASGRGGRLPSHQDYVFQPLPEPRYPEKEAP